MRFSLKSEDFPSLTLSTEVLSTAKRRKNSDSPPKLRFIEKSCVFPAQVYGRHGKYRPDLEKPGSGGSGARGHFVGNSAILRTFSVKYTIFLTEN